MPKRATAMPMSRVRQLALIAMGWTIIVAGLLVSPLPGPGGIPIIIVGVGFLLRHSADARRGFVRMKRRYPAAFKVVDRVLRRRR